jgi:two-component system, NarL family, sensor kinase
MQDPLSEVVLIVVGSSVIIFLLTGFIIFALLIVQKRKFLYAQRITDIQHNFEQEVLKTQLETQSQTFEAISQELHDNVGTMVSIAIVHLKTIASNSAINTTDKKNLTESQKLLEEALDVLRDISRSMNPDNVSRLGLINSFKNELDLIKRTKSIRTNYVIKGQEFNIIPQHQIIIFRIVQESLNNILKHSGASLLTLSVIFEDPLLEVILEDDGKGFVVSEKIENPGKSSGLMNMKKRAGIIKSTLNIESQKEKGTRVQFIYTKKE